MEALLEKMEHTKMDIIRYKGQWYSIKPKQYEPEKQTFKIGWDIVKNNKTSEDAYREFWKTQREEAKVLYPVFRKDADSS